jgi:2,3-bisphosphoglycerate-dependent phosphoglycerate mutase/probable phosphoglycerate mutase
VLLYVVRHAQSESNAKVPGAGKDSRLTELGRQQAAAVAARLAGIGIDRVLASPYTRALETADAIRRATGAPAGIVPLLHEHHVEPLQSDKDEDWPFLTRTALTERFPHFEPPADFAFGPRWHDIPEEDDAVVRRGQRVVEDLWHKYSSPPDANPDIRLALVTHGSPAGKLLLGLLGVPTARGINVRIDNASLSIVDYAPHHRVLLASNRVDHLAHLDVDLATQDPGYPLPKA